jgi:hypothetical protein
MLFCFLEFSIGIISKSAGKVYTCTDINSPTKGSKL